jgi:hypothetical protein
VAMSPTRGLYAGSDLFSSGRVSATYGYCQPVGVPGHRLGKGRGDDRLFRCPKGFQSARERLRAIETEFWLKLRID